MISTVFTRMYCHEYFRLRTSIKLKLITAVTDTKITREET